MEVVWVCFDVLFFISEFHFLFLLIFILFCKKEMRGEQKKQIYHYTMHTQIFTMFVNISIFAILFQKYFNSKYNKFIKS
jgi:hypothetical protein